MASTFDISCTLDDDQKAMVRRVWAKCAELLDTGQMTGTEPRVAWTEIEYAARDIVLDAPRDAIRRLGKTEKIQGELNPVGTGAEGLVVTLPADYLRFLSVKAPHWNTQVTTLLPQSDARYKFQSMPYCHATPYGPLAFQSDQDGFEILLFPATPEPGCTEKVDLEISLRYLADPDPKTWPRMFWDALFQRAAERLLGIEREEGARQEKASQYERSLTGLARVEA